MSETRIISETTNAIEWADAMSSSPETNSSAHVEEVTYTSAQLEEIFGNVFAQQSAQGQTRNQQPFPAPQTNRLPTVQEVRSLRPTQQQIDNDKWLAEVFGNPSRDEDVVAAGNGFEPEGMPGTENGRFRGDYTYNGRIQRGHLSSRAMHLYGNSDGSKIAGVYIPRGFTRIYPNPQTLPEYRGGSFVAFYPRLGNLRNVSLIVTHVADFTPNSNRTNAQGSVYIGNVGGAGSERGNRHAHFEIVQGQVVRGRSTTAMRHYAFFEVFPTPPSRRTQTR